ncbi:MAG TPA: ABC transporter permease [Streptosporangiaceae bacterium]|jgi:ABC-2 type transport system permease protein
MSTATYAIRDTRTMLRRNLRHVLRYPSMTLLLIGMPVIFLLLFVYVFGGALGSGLDGMSGGLTGRAAYVNYIVPGILIFTLTGVVQGTSVSVAMDMTEGIVARFKTMSIFRASLLAGHVIATMIQALASLAVVVGLALAVGFRPHAGVAGWLGATGMLVLAALALTWLAVAAGMACKTVESASNVLMPLVLLPLLGSGFVPTASMPLVLRWFADYQPFTPIMETLRGLLTGTPIGHNAVIAVGWCVAIVIASYFWARALFNRDPSS